jgi:dipeptidyl aminopeptidase/acylaminoacyl peptidase
MKPDKPILVIHGEKDDLVPLRHSQIIFNEIVKKDYPPKIICRFHVSETMTHNALNYKQDLADPIKNFFKDN